MSESKHAIGMFQLKYSWWAVSFYKLYISVG